MTRAFVFPGQGSQSVGMGQELAEAFPAARETFEEVDDALERRLTKIMWDGPIEDLTQTVNAQPALMAHSIAMIRVLEAETGLDIADSIFVAGHSLGEYSALCASGALSLAQTAQLLRVRGEAMQKAADATDGAMAALIGVNAEGAQNAIDAAKSDEVCQIANDNAPGQIVISGARERVEEVAGLAKEHGAKMAKLLPVSGAFHSELMQSAADQMKEALATAKIVAPKVPLVANVTALETTDPEEIRDQLVEQVTGRVRWTESVDYMVSKGCEKIFEIGTGKVLSGLVKRINRDVPVMALGSPSDIEGFLKE